MRHTVRERLRRTSGAQAAIALFVLAIVFVVTGAALMASRDDESSPAAGPTPTTTAASVSPEPSVKDQEPVGDKQSSVTGLLAGFGLLGLWLACGGIALYRAQRRRGDALERAEREVDGR